MKKTLLAIAIGVAASASAFANNMYINVPGYDYTAGTHTADAGSTTGLFDEFGYSQNLATSIYDLSDGDILGSFYDTNIASQLTALGIPTSGQAMDGLSTVTLKMPTPAQIDLDALSPLVPPLSADSEGFLFTWGLNILYKFTGTLTPTGPSYTGGFFEVWFDDYLGANDRKVLGGNLMGSSLQAANLNLFFDLTFAEAGFLFIEDGSGNFIDANTLTSVVNPYEFVLDTNVNPPIPTLNQLLMVNDGNNQGLPAAVRQATLDGSITSNIPEPGTIALLGLGLLGLGLARRRSIQ